MKSHKEIAERLKERGLRHWYEYVHFDNAKPRTRVILSRWGEKSQPWKIAATRFIVGPEVAYGQADCADRDQFVKAKGREIALRRALVEAKKLELVTGDDIAYCMSGSSRKESK